MSGSRTPHRTNHSHRPETDPSPPMALEVRRVDVETGELLMPWTTFPSQTAAARALKAQGLTDPTISRLTRGLEPHWNGFEARRCGARDGGAAADDADDEAGARAHPSPPHLASTLSANARASNSTVAVEVRCSIERAREGGGPLAPHREPAISIAPHSVRGDPSLSTLGVSGATRRR